MNVRQLFAPWRMKYILDPSREGRCFLCEAASASEDQWPELLVVYRDDTTVAVLNRFPYSNGHVLVAPLSHKEDLPALEPAERAGLMETLLRMEEAVRKVCLPHGFNIGLNIGAMAGAGLPGHLHFHIVPRWQADTNYMPVLADVKVIPQALQDTRELLLKALEESS